MRPHLGFNGVGLRRAGERGLTMRILDTRHRVASPVVYSGPPDVARINAFTRSHAVKPLGARKLIQRGCVVVDNLRLVVHAEPLVFDRVRCHLSNLDVTCDGTRAIVINRSEGSVLRDSSITRASA